MYRYLIDKMTDWLNSPSRKPLILRGARQVGKTWLVRELARVSGKKLIEINLEQQHALSVHFASNDPKIILLNLQSALNQFIDPAHSLLFLDEIQATPELLAKLRWFYECMPELAIVATGSLLEFALKEHEFSMPVGRIQYFFVEPLGFEEFLQAKQELFLLAAIKQVTLSSPLNQALHQKANQLMKEYLIVGGMPEAVNCWVTASSLEALSEVHHNLINTYKDDFAKYAGTLPKQHLEAVLTALPTMLAHKLMYRHIHPTVRHELLKQAVELLVNARLCHKVQAVAANGIPLAAEVNPKIMKMILVDVGLVSSMLGLRLFHLASLDELMFINSGALMEQLSGQLLRLLTPHYIEPKLYYWVREHASSTAEVDYVIQDNQYIIPLEVKAGVEGKLRSLHQFMFEKKGNLAVRLYAGELNQTKINTRTPNGGVIEYELLSVPFYLISELYRITAKSANCLNLVGKE